MKVSFEDKSFIEIKKSDKPDFVYIIISAKDFNNPLKKITNSVEISQEQLKMLLSSL